MIALQNINFRYAGGNDAGGLENINLTIPDGQVLLLCGNWLRKNHFDPIDKRAYPNYYEGKLTGNVLLNGKISASFPFVKLLNMLAASFKIHGHNFLQ